MNNRCKYSLNHYKPLLFLIYVNDLADDLSSNTKLFADDTSLFSVMHDSVITTSELNSDLARIKQQAFQWKMRFNPDPNKQAQEVIFSRKLKKFCQNLANIPSLIFKHNFFKNTFFPSTILEWNKLDPSLRNSSSYNVFKNSILKFIRPFPNKIFQCHNAKGIKLVTRLRLGLSRL